MDPPLLPELPALTKDLKEASGLPISLSIPPLSAEIMRNLKDAGADRVGIALDASNPAIFDRVKGREVGNPHTFQTIKGSLLRAVGVFGPGNVSTHIIIGLGETDSDVFNVLKWSRENGIIVSLFALTKVRGGPDLGPPPSIGRYRAMQALRHLMMELGTENGIAFDRSGELISVPDISTVDPNGWMRAFETRGCPDCNRPYYNERPGGILYNYPFALTEAQASRALKEVSDHVR
jgi:biotin synthase